MFLCQLTGSVPVNPVVTVSGGNVYEKSALQAHLRNHNNVPPEGGAAIVDFDKEVIELKPNNCLNKPSSAVALTEVTLLADALKERAQDMMVELQSVKKERDEARHQLTHLLYLRDSAAQVIAKHLEEIEFLKQQLQDARQQPPERGAKLARTSSAQSLDSIKATSTLLMQARKQRTIRARPKEDFKTFVRSVHAPVERPAVAALCFKDVVARAGNNGRTPGLFATGFDDGRMVISACVPDAEQRDLALLHAHEAPLTCLESLLYPSEADLSAVILGHLNSSSSSAHPFESCLNFFSGSTDGTVRHWKDTKMDALDRMLWLAEDASTGRLLAKDVTDINFTLACQHVYRPDLLSISSLKLHPSGTLLGVSGQCNRVSIFDIAASELATHLVMTGVDPSVKCHQIEFQPDGSLAVCATTSNSLPIWDVRTASLEANPKTSAPLKSISFSEVGYQVAVATADDNLTIWDLRKLSPITSMSMKDIQSCRYDNSGKHIAVVSSHSSSITIVSAIDKKRFDIVAELDAQAPIQHCAFDHITDDYLAALTPDGTIISFRPPTLQD